MIDDGVSSHAVLTQEQEDSDSELAERLNTAICVDKDNTKRKRINLTTTTICENTIVSNNLFQKCEGKK